MKFKRVLSLIYMIIAVLALIVALYLMGTKDTVLGWALISSFLSLFSLGLNYRTEYNSERSSAISCFIREVDHILEKFTKVPYFCSFVPDEIIKSCLQREQDRVESKSRQLLRWAKDMEWDEGMSSYFAEIERGLIDESIPTDNSSNDDGLDLLSAYIVGDLSKDLEYAFQMYVEVGDMSMTDLSSCLHEIKCSCEKKLAMKAQLLYEDISSEILYAKSITENLVNRSRRLNSPWLEMFRKVRRLNERWFAQEHSKTDGYERIMLYPKVVYLVYEQSQEIGSYVLKKRLRTGGDKD